MDKTGITMIGLSNSGKSCYLYAMYAQMAFGVNGFTFIPDDFDKGLDLEDQWLKIVEEGKWPDSNVESSDYVFDCSHSFRKLISFHWHDYRGNILKERNNSEKTELFNKINQSNSLILCISAELLIALLNGSQSAALEIAKYGKILLDYRNISNRTIPISIAITKSDIIAHDQSIFINGIKQLKEKYLNSLFTDNGNWFVMFVPVMLGEGLLNQEGKVSGTIAPKNIHLPVMFAIYATFNELHNQTKNTSEELKRSMTSELNKSDWTKFWNGDSSNYYRNELEKNNANLEAISKDLARITAEFRDNSCLFFYNGKKVTV